MNFGSEAAICIAMSCTSSLNSSVRDRPGRVIGPSGRSGSGNPLLRLIDKCLDRREADQRANLEEVLEDYAHLMHRLLEIQSGDERRGPELTEEDERLMDALRKRSLAGESPQSVEASPKNPTRMRFKLSLFQ